MRMFSGSDDDFLEDDGPMFGGGDRMDEKRQKLERAKEIASGLVMGTLERDEEVWAMVRQIREKGGE